LQFVGNEAVDLAWWSS